jgi:hypothetical protein
MTLLTPPSSAFNKWLATLPTTAFVIVSGVVIAFLTAGVVLTALIMGTNIPWEGLGLWLAFVAAMLHIGYQSYVTKRKTFIPNLAPTGLVPTALRQRLLDKTGIDLDEISTGASSSPGADGALMESSGGTSYHVLPVDQVPDYLRPLPSQSRRPSPADAGANAADSHAPAGTSRRPAFNPGNSDA